MASSTTVEGGVMGPAFNLKVQCLFAFHCTIPKLLGGVRMTKVLSMAAALLLVAGVAFGGIIDPCNSTATCGGGGGAASPASVGCVLVCPAGDGDQISAKVAGGAIFVTVRDGSSIGIPGIPATDFWLVDCDPLLDMVLCGGSSSSSATAATDENGETTMEGDIAAGGCADGLSVVVQGFIIEEGTPPDCTPVCLDIDIRSPDMNGDLAVNLLDFALFGGAYPPNAYSKCADFNCDLAVNLQDFSAFGLHYNHDC